MSARGVVKQRGDDADDIARLSAGGGQGQRDVATAIGRRHDAGDRRAAEIVDQQGDVARCLGGDDAELALQVGRRLAPVPSTTTRAPGSATPVAS
ncbi:hypothetical protein [Sphingomonas sp. S-NIH.Pt15_0812]|uniref:hypothetical protein n=1 Tax=Sphingomonas sp. S-NIH.Pt15_0812 TaxID=1920129 RepID=UPI000F7F2FC6|nr:hypothetical protein [Sphingomonas sp. S-NIH.Pt15_0812]